MKRTLTLRLIFSCSFFFILVNVFSQGNTPCTATTLTIGSTCTYQGGTTVGATFSNDNFPVPTCGGAGSTGSPDAWYTFTPTVSGNHTINTTANSITDLVLQLYSATNCNGTGTETTVACDDDSGAGSMPMLSANLTAGTVYYIRVWNWGTTGTGTFNICLSGPLANDACSGATNLPCGTTNLAGTTVNSVSEALPGCSGYVSNYGVWYTFVGDGQQTTISAAGNSFDIGMAIFSGSCASKTQLYCRDAGTGTESQTFTTVNGTTYFVYIAYYDDFSSLTGTFNISRTCTAAPTPPANDACGSATNLPCGTSNLAGTTVNSVSETAPPTCGMSGYGVWYTFTGDGQITTITLQGNSYDTGLGIYFGSCGSFTNITCQDATFASDPETYTFTTTNGTVYYVYVAYYTTGTTTGTFTISRSCTPAPTPPSNDACSNATNLPCGTTNLAGTTVNSVSETAPPTCGMSNYGVWYSFTGDGQITTITLQGNSYDTGLGIYTGSCGSFSNITCQDATFASDPETFTFTTVNGTIYYIYVAYFESSTTTGTFTISRTCVAAPPPPSNDNCPSAASLPCGTSNLAGTTVNTGIEAIPGCSGDVSNYGVWYTFTGDGQQTTLTVNTAGFDAGMGVFSGTCASKTQLYCTDLTGASGNETVIFTTVNGTTYYVYVAHFNSSGAVTGTFNISRSCNAVSPCGNPATNDFCSSPATLTEGPGTFSATTDGTFTADQTQIESSLFGSGLFCGSIENNSWYIFTANTTTESFPIASVTGCVWGDGIQGQVFQIGRDGNQCCTSFTSMSNCYNPGTTALGTITATGLTIGASYVLMIDGYAGDGCDFTISNWTATGILPVEMTSFTGTPEEFGDLLIWTTASEINNDYFTIRHSRDGINYSEIGRVDGSGTSSTFKNYSFINNDAREGLNYYQLEQVDFNGFKKASEVIKIQRFEYAEAIVKIYPNPTQDNAFFEYYSNDDRKIRYKLIDCIGNVLEENVSFIEKGTSIFPIQLNQLPSGMYLLEIESADKVNSFKIIKN